MIRPCCDRKATSGRGTKCSCKGVRKICAKNFPANINIDQYTLRLLILPKTCSKVRNSVFATHCTVDTFDIVRTSSHTVAISEIHRVTPSTTFLTIISILQISETLCDIRFSSGVYEADIRRC